jgi:NADPH:quinone reductase-like Zn-dependent oxidoreductase
MVKCGVRVLAAGVSLPDIMAREGVHPETSPVPFPPGWDVVGVADQFGDGVSGIGPGQIVAAHAEPQRFLLSVYRASLRSSVYDYEGLFAFTNRLRRNVRQRATIYLRRQYAPVQTAQERY